MWEVKLYHTVIHVVILSQNMRVVVAWSLPWRDFGTKEKQRVELCELYSKSKHSPAVAQRFTEIFPKVA